MIGCPACGHGNQDGARFCNQCGSRLEMRCSACDAGNPPGSRFCQACGAPLTPARTTGEAPGGAKRPAGEAGAPAGYTPRHLAERVLPRAAEGERKQVTVLFADVVNYTALAEDSDPEETHAIMDRCFAILLDEVHRFSGTVNQFTGDGVMALFGAPIAQEDHARLALNAAFCIQRALHDYSAQLRERGIEFRMRLGLNTGPVVVGRIGDDLRSDYTAVGDTTNVAARMLSLAEPGTIVASENTYRLAQSYFTFESLGRVQVKGRQKPVEAYRVTGLGQVRTRMQAVLGRGFTPFTGRTREMAVLTDAFARARDGQGGIVLIRGDAGMGKSRLAQEFQRGLDNGRVLRFEATCTPFSQPFPYYPFVEITRAYCEIGDDDDEQRIREKTHRK
jgi:class 3 adenylate cyclase